MSAWYHIVLAVDTTNATANNRIRMYVNGSEITAFSSRSNPSQNADLAINNNTLQTIGITDETGTLNRKFDGYITECYFIDGSAKTPSDFGETDTDTGVWKPKAYSGSYGTNGFYLKFADNSGTTSTTLGKDSSGNGNNWTPNNFSVTAGAGNDSLVDTPTPYGTDTGAGGEVRGNYATLNPTAVSAISLPTISNGNLDTTSASGNYTGSVSTIAMSTGKWYWEHTATNTGTGGLNGTGIINVASLSSATTGWGFAAPTDGWMRTGTAVNNNAANSVTGLSTIANGDVINVAVDFDAGKLWFGRNGTWESSGNPATGSNATVTFTVGGKSFYAAVHGFAGSASWVGSTNFGQRPFAYTAPSGFKALCTQNLPTPTIGATSTTQASQYFTPVLYTGDGTDNRTISAGMTPDWTWIKARNNTNANTLFDSVRGTGKYLFTNSTDAENAYGTLGWTNSGPTTSGFKVDAGTNGTINGNGTTFVAWNWKANGAGSTNTSGTITSTVSANTTAGFSIVTWNGSGNATIGHGLGVAPSMYIVKLRDQTSQWYVYHKSLGADKYLQLNLTAGFVTDTAIWQNTAPTSTVFYIGSGINANNMVAYCFAPVAGYSAFGSYTGNGSSDGPMIFTNHRPALVLVKRTDSTGNWTILDNKREGYNVDNDPLYPNLSDAEGTTDLVDIVSNGFKVRSTDTSVNANGGTYIYMSIAENPFKYSLGR